MVVDDVVFSILGCHTTWPRFNSHLDLWTGVKPYELDALVGEHVYVGKCVDNYTLVGILTNNHENFAQLTSYQ